MRKQMKLLESENQILKNNKSNDEAYQLQNLVSKEI
jgi:hypothetical protein